MQRKEDLFITCPRCKEKNFKNQKKCSECGLVFDKLNYVTNRAGKIAVVKREKEKILKVDKWPPDVKKHKALLLCGFLGFLGIHNFYLGRYLKGAFSLFVTLVASICILLENYIDYSKFYETFFFLPTAIMFIFWWLDFILILINKYKIPVAIDYEYFGIKTKNEILQEIADCENKKAEEKVDNVVNILDNKGKKE